MIAGPVEFRMGSPPMSRNTEPAIRITRTGGCDPGRFAIARPRSRSTSSRGFSAPIPAPATTCRHFVNRYSPDPDGPWVTPNWYMAAHYCNWLSEQEGLPKDQWCYVPTEGRATPTG